VRIRKGQRKKGRDREGEKINKKRPSYFTKRNEKREKEKEKRRNSRREEENTETG